MGTRTAAKPTKARTSAGQGQRATDATMPTSTAAKPSHSAKRPGRSTSTANKASASANQDQETSEPSCITHDPERWAPVFGKKSCAKIRSHPALQLTHGELPDHQHAGLAVVEAGNRREVLSADTFERARIVDRDLFQRLQAIGGKSRRHHDHVLDALLRQRLHGIDGVRLEPFGAAEARLEG